MQLARRRAANDKIVNCVICYRMPRFRRFSWQAVGTGEDGFGYTGLTKCHIVESRWGHLRCDQKNVWFISVIVVLVFSVITVVIGSDQVLWSRARE
jgi:hypothetical protein